MPRNKQEMIRRWTLIEESSDGCLVKGPLRVVFYGSGTRECHV